MPDILIVAAQLPSASISFAGGHVTLKLTKGFLELPADKKKAVLYHEALHGFEPVIDNVDVRQWFMRRMAMNVVTINALSRKREYNADDNAAAFGYAESLASALQIVQEAKIPGIRESLETQHFVAKAAVDNGFSIDRKKVIELWDASRPPEKTIKQKIIAPVTHLCASVLVKSANKSLETFAKTSPKKLMSRVLNPRFGPFNAATHPKTEERAARLLSGEDQRTR